MKKILFYLATLATLPTFAQVTPVEPKKPPVIFHVITFAFEMASGTVLNISYGDSVDINQLTNDSIVSVKLTRPDNLDVRLKNITIVDVPKTGDGAAYSCSNLETLTKYAGSIMKKAKTGDRVIITDFRVYEGETEMSQPPVLFYFY